MSCKACQHEKKLQQAEISDDYLWLDVVEEIKEKHKGHMCNDRNCPHTCELMEYY